MDVCHHGLVHLQVHEPSHVLQQAVLHFPTTCSRMAVMILNVFFFLAEYHKNGLNLKKHYVRRQKAFLRHHPKRKGTVQL